MVINFSAGPAKIPVDVLKQVQSELLDFAGTGMSITELSHRSPEFTLLLKDTSALLREIMDVPDNYQILWLAGGASGLFSSIPLNLISSKDDVVDHIVTGNWSKGAAKEAEKYTNVNYVVPVPANFSGLPIEEEMKFSPGAKYIHYCDNETVYGIEFSNVVKGEASLVCDMSSNFLTRPVDVSKFGMIYAGVQKNLSTAGLAVAIIREDLITTDRLHPVPKIWDYKLQVDGASCVNTPNVFSIYITNLVLKHLLSNGGLKRYAELSEEKSKMIYNLIDDSGGFYICQIDKDARSRMNVTFNIKNACLESEFVKKAKECKMEGIKGHRLVGGMRASLYNAITLKDVKSLADFMTSFMKSH